MRHLLENRGGDDLSYPLVCLFESDNPIRLVREAIKSEVAQAVRHGKVEMLMRHNTNATRVITLYGRLDAHEFFRKVLTAPINTVLKSVLVFRLDQPSGTPGGGFRSRRTSTASTAS